MKKYIIICFISSLILNPILNAQTVTDIDGNVYNTVTIGSQVWMAENLKTTKYNNGFAIPGSYTNSAWSTLTSGARTYYNNDSIISASTYGTLYNWYATSNPNNLCPSGWRVPTDNDWSELINFAGGLNVSGGILKEKGTLHWLIPNTDATNAYGFTGLPGGLRHVTGPYQYQTYHGWFWSSTSQSSTWAYNVKMSYDTGAMLHYTSEKNAGFSVRCMTDASNIFNGNEKTNTIKIYPNPVVKDLNIEINSKAEITILNTLGQILKRISTDNPFNRINISDLSNGIYTIIIRTNQEVYTEKFIKQ